MTVKKGTSPWIYFGCGCVAFALLLIGGCVAFMFTMGKWAQDFGEQLEDPVARNDRAMEMLGTDELPAGYHAQFFMSLPWIMNMVMLSDGEPVEYRDGQARVESQDLGDNALFYLSMRDFGGQRQEFEKLLEGDLDNTRFNLNFDFDPDEELGRGEIEVGSQQIRYASFTGSFQDSEGRDLSGIYTVMLIDCPSKSRVRLAYYWSQEVSVGTGYAGTPADEETLRAFMGHFDVCSGG